MTNKNLPTHLPPPAFPPGQGFAPKPGLDGKGDMSNPKKSGRQHRRNLASPCDRPPMAPDNVKMHFRAVEAKTHLNFKANITWDDVTTDTSGITINTVDRWDVQWRAVDDDGDPVEVEHSALLSATNPSGSNFHYHTTRAISPDREGGFEWHVGDRVKIRGCYPETNYNGTFTITSIPSADVFVVNGGHTGELDAKRVGEVYNLSTDQHYRRKLRNPVQKIALRSATHTTSPNKHHFKTRGANGFNAGQRINVSGCRPQTSYNGNWEIDAIQGEDEFTVLGGSGALADAEVLGKVTDRDDFPHVVVHHLPRPKTWSWQARVRCRSGEGCWSAFSSWTDAVLPWDGADPKPPVPTYGEFPITFDHKGKGKHRKIRLLFTFDEVEFWDVPGGDREDDVAQYDVQLDQSTDGINWDTGHGSAGPYRTHTRPAKDGDADSTRTATFNEIHRAYWYRCRVRTRDRFHRRGEWSEWTDGALPFDDDAPPPPTDVQVYPASTDRVVVAWEDPTITIPCVGTVSGTSATATLTGVGTKFHLQLEAGTTIMVEAETYIVKKITSATALTLTTDLVTSPAAAQLYEVAEDPDVSLYGVQLAKFADVDLGATPNEWSDVYAHDRVEGTRKAFKIPDRDVDETFFARVRSIDAARNRSVWIPAWDVAQHSGAANSESDVDGDGVVVIPGGSIITATWNYPGRLNKDVFDLDDDGDTTDHIADPYEIPTRWENQTGVRLYFKNCVLTCGDKEAGTGEPTGTGIIVQMRRWETDEVTPHVMFDPTGGDDRPKIGTNDYRGTSNTFQSGGRFLDPGEAVSCTLFQYGSTNPGSNLRVQLTMSPAAPVQS